MIETLRAWSEQRLIRRLDCAFAAFIAELDPSASAETVLAAAMLSRAEELGHSCLPLSELCPASITFFGWATEHEAALGDVWRTLPVQPERWLHAISASRAVRRIGRDDERGQPLVLDGPDSAPRLYLRRYWQHERTVEQAIRARSGAELEVDPLTARVWIDRLFGGDTAPYQLDADGAASVIDWQRIACAIALRQRLTIMTGGPGTGKTYTAARLLALLLATESAPDTMRIALAAPTGKAAARLRQAIDGSLKGLQARVSPDLDLSGLIQRIGAARTLHSLLGARPDSRRFRHHRGNPLPADVVIVDEASMIHLEMMAALLDALTPSARLILIGDKDQLASVEAGAVFGDLCRNADTTQYDAACADFLSAAAGQHLPAPFIAANTGPTGLLGQQTVMLRTSRRFDGPIGELARSVNDGSDPARARAMLFADPSRTLFAAEAVGIDTAIELAIRGRPGAEACYRPYLERLGEQPRLASADAHQQWAAAVLKAFERFRLLGAVRDGAWGVEGLNQAIERALERAGLLSARATWYAGRPVMVTRNDTALGVFNGDVGIALPGAEDPTRLRVHFLDGERLRTVAVGRLAHVETAFAITVHKSQGSEFEHTALVLAGHSGNVLTRELIYTAITRASKEFSLIAERPGLLEAGIARPTRRESGLREL